MKSQRLRFKNSLGIELGARLDRPDPGLPVAYAVFSHCFTCNKDYKFIRQVSRALTEHGIAVLCLDFTGLGESGGRFEDSNFSTSVADVVAAARFLADNYQPPALLVGHSLGGTVMLAAAAELPCVRAVATLNAPFEPRHIFHHFSGIADQVENLGEAKTEIGGKTYRITRQLLRDLGERRMEDAIRGMDAALLILHAPQDETVDIDNAARIYGAARHPKSFVALDGADHLLSREADAQYAGRLIAAWAERYCGRDTGRDAAGGSSAVKIFRGRIIDVEVGTVILPNGSPLELETVRHPGGAAVVALDAQERICLLRQYRPVIDEWLWEVPAGKIDDGEPPLVAAQRELAEEAGFAAVRWEELGHVVSSPGVFTERVHLYLARDLSAVPDTPHPDEIFELHWIPLRAALAQARGGEISDAKSVIALFRAAALLGIL